MADQDTGAPTSAPASIEARMSAFFKSEDTPTDTPQPEPPTRPAQRVQAPAEPSDAEVTDDVTPEDLQDEGEAEAQTSADAGDFELTYNGNALKVGRDEARNLAQLGYHLKQQQDRIASEMQQATAQAQQIQQAVQQQAKLLPELRTLDLEVHALESRLTGIDQNALAKLAAEDPAQYIQIRAQIDQIQSAYNQARGRRDLAFQQFQQNQQQMQQQTLAAEMQMLQRIAPVFKDTAKARQAQEQIVASLQGARPQTIEAIANNAELTAMAYKAARYDQLQASKREKLQTAAKAPAVAKPGTGQTVADTRGERDKALKAQLRKSGSVDDAARLFAARFTR